MSAGLIDDMRISLDLIEQKMEAVKTELNKIKSLCDEDKPVYYGLRREILVACDRVLRALEEP